MNFETAYLSNCFMARNVSADVRYEPRNNTLSHAEYENGQRLSRMNLYILIYWKLRFLQKS